LSKETALDFNLNLSISSVFSGIIASGVGLFLFRAGKRNSNLAHLLIGIALFIYPFFTHTPAGDWGIGIFLCLLAWFLR